MSNYKINFIDLEKLVVNIENPRFDPVNNQVKAIEVMVENQNKRIVKLAKDILENGLNPSELIIVLRIGDKYKVLEGNRRVTALKLLKNPDILDGIDLKIKEELIKILNESSKNIITKINCTVFEDEREANRWIELKHTGQNEGIGTVPWDSEAKGRFDFKQKGIKREGIQLIDYIKESDKFNEDIKDKLEKVSVTNLERLIKDPHVREVLGLEVEKGLLKTAYPDIEISKGLSKVIEDLSDDRFKVKDIYNKEDRLDYISKFTKENLPNSEKKTEIKRVIDNTTGEIAKDDKKNERDEQKKEVSEKTNEKKSSRLREKKFSYDRKNLIPKGFILRIDNQRINNIYKELKALEIDRFINSGAVLFRVFIELSLDEFIEKTNLTGIDNNSKLLKKLSGVLEYMKKEKLLDKDEAKPIDKAVSSPISIMSINTFNSYVHNKNIYPSPQELKITWDNIERFLEVLWEEIRNK